MNVEALRTLADESEGGAKTEELVEDHTESN